MVAQRKGKLITSLLPASTSSSFAPNDREKAMFAYIRLVILSGMPVSIVKNNFKRNFSKFSHVFSTTLFQETFFKLMELVEARISREMRSTKDLSSMMDVLSMVRISLEFCAYMRTVNETARGIPRQKQELSMPLISVSPVVSTGETEDETTSFDAKTHVSHFSEVFNFFGVDIKEWALCQIADNASTNKSIAR